MAAALSLVCQQCGTQLKSVKEAQDHGEATGHSQFAESTEAVRRQQGQQQHRLRHPDAKSRDVNGYQTKGCEWFKCKVMTGAKHAAASRVYATRTDAH